MPRLWRMKLLLSALAVLVAVLFWALPGARAGAGFRDDSGRELVLTRPFTRIISLYGAHTENLFFLGLDQEIIGVGRNEDFPSRALAKPVFDYRDGPERFIAARPDLVLVRPMILQGYQGLVDKLERAGITVVSLQPTGVETMLEYWLRLGELTGREKEARAMAGRFKDELEGLRSKTADVPPEKRPRVFFEAIHARMKTFSPSSLAIFALESAGGVNVAAGARAVRGGNIAAFGKERILSHATEIDVYLAQKGPMNRVGVEDIGREPGFAAIKAVRLKRVHLIEEKLVSRPTMRLLEGIRRIGTLLYPDRFRD